VEVTCYVVFLALVMYIGFSPDSVCSLFLFFFTQLFFLGGGDGSIFMLVLRSIFQIFKPLSSSNSGGHCCRG